MILRGHNTRVLVGVTAALLLIGTATFAATSPGGSRPRSSDLPVISLTRNLNAPSTIPTVAPAATDTVAVIPPTTPVKPPTAQAPTISHTPAASPDDSDCEREVVSPPIRDKDPDEDAIDDGERESSPVRESLDDQ